MAECKDILKKVFYILDGNFDDWFNLEDLDQLDELALVDLNKKISKMTERFNKLNEKHLENINKVYIYQSQTLKLQYNNQHISIFNYQML